MTDTTDIKALRAETWDLHTMQDATEFADRLLDLLEAERQRADANTQEIRRLEFQWENRAPTQWAYDQTCTALHAQRERAEKAEAEIAVLKAKLANPVVLRKVIEPDDVDSILDPTANPDEYAKCVGSDMWNAAMTFAVKATYAAGFTVKE